MLKRLYPPRPQKVLVVAAHPDDIEFNFSGTAAKWAGEGSEITYALCTSGDAGSHDLTMPPEKLAPIRQAEQRAAAQLLGVEQVVFLDYRDGMMENTLDLRRDITRLIRQYQPDAVITWDPARRYAGDSYFNHPDHIIVGDACLAALMPSCDSPFIFPELMDEGYQPFKVHHVYLFAPQEANVCENISGSLEVKIAALRCHASQIQGWDTIVEDVQSSARTKGQPFDVPYAEIFRYFYLD